MVNEKNKGSRLSRIFGGLILSGVALTLMFPIFKSQYNKICHNKSRVTEVSENHQFADSLDSWVEYSRFQDGIEQIKVYPGTFDQLMRLEKFPFDSFEYRTIFGSDKVQEIRIHGGKLETGGFDAIRTRDIDYENYLGSFNYGDELLITVRRRAETRKSNGEYNQKPKPFLFRFDE